MIKMIGRLAAWGVALAIVVLSLIPPTVRPVTAVSHNLEHFAIFLICGLAFGLGHSERPVRLIVGLVAFSAAVELCQLWVPGRHARVSDFVIDVVAVCIGVGSGYFIERMRKARALAHQMPTARFER